VSSPAEAALTETNYGYRAWAFGTTVRADQSGMSSAPTAFAYLGCTRLAGRVDDNFVGAVNAPANAPSVKIGAVTSHAETFKSGGDSGSKSTAKIAGLVLGPADGPHLELKGLTTAAKVWADKNGKFHTAESFQLASLTANTGTPLDQLNDVTSGLFGQLAHLITSSTGNNLVIPGLGRIALGRGVSNIQPTKAVSNAIALRIMLFGPNGVERGGDDVSVLVGRSQAKIYRDLPAGVMGGSAYAADVSVLDGLVGVGKLARKPLPCNGTGGKVLEHSVAGLDLANLGVLQFGVATGSVYGLQRKDGSANAWTEGRLNSFSLGTGDTKLLIRGVVGRANVTRTKSGKLIRSKQGTQVGSITFGGKEYDAPEPGDVLEIPGLARIRFGIVETPGTRAIKVTALRVIPIPSVAEKTGLTAVNLGVVQVQLKRY